jgi:hypothetical protein
VHAPCEDKGDDMKDSFYEELGRVFDQFPRYDMKILLGDFTVKVGTENIFKQTIGNESLHEISNDNGVTVVNFATSKNLVVKSTMFLNHKIHKYTWTSPGGNTHNQIDHVLTDRRRHSSMLDVRSFRGADCDTDSYLVLAKVRERLAVSKRAAQKVDTERFNLKNVNRACDNIRESIKISAQKSLGYWESKHLKLWFDVECSKSVDRRKQVKCSCFRTKVK